MELCFRFINACTVFSNVRNNQVFIELFQCLDNNYYFYIELRMQLEVKSQKEVKFESTIEGFVKKEKKHRYTHVHILAHDRVFVS